MNEGAQAGGGGLDGIDPMAVLRAARKYWLMVLVIVTAVSVAAVFQALGQKRVYSSVATLRIEASPPRPLGKDVVQVVDSSAYWSNQEYLATQLKIITSRSTLLATVRRAGLDKDAAFLADSAPGEAPPGVTADPEQAASLLRDRVSVEPEKDTRLVRVTLRAGDPERARRVLGQLLQTYVDQNKEENATTSDSATRWLKTQADALKGELEKSELKLHEYKKNKGILSFSVDDQNNMLRAAMEQFNTRLSQVKADRARVNGRYAQLMKVTADDPDSLPATELLASPLLQDLRAKFVNARQARDRLAAMGRGINHPDVRAAESEVEGTRTALLAEVKNIQRGVAKDLAALDAELGGLSALCDGTKGQALDLNLLDIEYRRMERLKENNERLYSVVLERAKENELSGLEQFENIRVVDDPAPAVGLQSKRTMTVFGGVLFGLVLGVGAAFARLQLDRTLKTREQVEGELGLSFLGALPSASLGKRKGRGGRRGPAEVGEAPLGLLLHAEPTSPLAEAARTVRTNVLFMGSERPLRTLLVTSASPGEGKTTVASWLAIAMAQAGQRVLLIDADLRRPCVHRVFGLGNETGLTLALLDGGGIDPGRVQTSIPNLSVLTAGPSAPNPAELLGGDRFAALLSELEQRYDRVILDSPPATVVTDAAILATRAAGTLLVVRAQVTARQNAARAIRALKDVGGRVLGAVLNDVRPTGDGYYKYQYYYDDKRSA